MNRQLPSNIFANDALDSIGEIILIADVEFNIIWMNKKASATLSVIAPLFGLESEEDMIGLNMDRFHQQPGYQRMIMSKFQEGHRARINIKNRFIADIVITPIKGNGNTDKIDGYMVMLMDVTTQAEEEKKKERIIRELSTPILHIWKKTIALTLVGEFDEKRGEILLTTVLKECESKGIDFVMISLRDIVLFDDSVRQYLQKLHDCLRLIGVSCIIVGIGPTLAINIQYLKDIVTFKNAYDGLKYIIGLQEKTNSA